MALLLAAADLLSLSVSVFIAFPLWSLANPLVAAFQPNMALAPLCCIVMFAFQGLYPGIGLTAVEHIRRVFLSITTVYLVLTAAMFLSRGWWADSRGGFFLSMAFSLAFAPAGRWICSLLFCERTWWGVPVMILGAGETARDVIVNLRENRILGYRPILCLEDDPQHGSTCEGVPVLGELSRASELASKFGIRYALVAMPRISRTRLMASMQVWSSIFFNVVIVSDLFGVASLWVEPRDLGGILGLEIRHNLMNPLNQWTKRAVDLVFSSIGIVLAAPIVAAAALWIRVASGGPAFYFQVREGKNGLPIRIAKLRTMHEGADRMLATYLESNPAAKQEWEKFFKLKNDPRILPGVGSLLRTTSLDELPQLWSILRGDMSLVGPRPFPDYHNSQFDPEFRNRRLRVAPGLTGMWQVSARSNGDLEVQRALDSYYIQNWSLWLDLYILIRTARVVIAREGAL